MKDLKNLIYFENLLQDANNELIVKAKKNGDLALGYTCYHMPEVLLNLDKCFSVRLRAPQTGSMDIATYYMSNYTCEYCRAILERSIEGGYNFLDAIAGVDACAEMNRCMENIEIQNLIDHPGFFVSHIDVPYKVDDGAVEHYEEQITRKVMLPLKNNFGVDISDESIRKAVEKFNEICRLITEIGEYRKEENPRITGYEFNVICMCSYVCPHSLIIDKLKETAEELKTRKADAKKNYRVKVVVVGSEVDDPDLLKLIEDSGALVVADRYCFGSFPGRKEIILNDTESALTQVCRHYLETSLCPRYMSHEKVDQRQKWAVEAFKDYNADGIIYEQMKFCDYWGYERTYTSHVISEDYNIPTLSIDRPYMSRSSGQLRTRFQAFVESLEIKKIQKESKKQ